MFICIRLLFLPCINANYPAQNNESIKIYKTFRVGIQIKLKYVWLYWNMPKNIDINERLGRELFKKILNKCIKYWYSAWLVYIFWNLNFKNVKMLTIKIKQKRLWITYNSYSNKYLLFLLKDWYQFEQFILGWKYFTKKKKKLWRLNFVNIFLTF